jgi:ATP-binding cassette subfamily F protein uup
MNYISVENLVKSYGDKLLFDAISFGIEKGQKVALIAQNGTGKSTLLNIIMGLEPADEGKVTCRNDIHVAYLPQINEDYDEHSILDVVLNTNSPLIKTVKEYEKALKAYSIDASVDNKRKLEKIMLKMDAIDAWNFENRVKEILSKFKIDDIFSNFNSLSGGERKKVALAQTLLSDSEVLLLDEPTNHLDIEMIEWLEDYLSNANMTFLLVTHDRFFLDNICSDILELDGGKLYKYKGKYDYFLIKKAERIANQLSEIESAKSVYRRELEWIKAIPQARTAN